MGWEKREGRRAKFHDHTFSKYKRRRIYMPDYVSREEWGAAPPWEEDDGHDPLPHPVKFVKVYYTESRKCNSLDECVTVLRDLQNTHIELGLNDIAWNFVVGGDGRKYEGRGWMIRPQMPWRAKQRKKKSLLIGMVGTIQEYRNCDLGMTEYMSDALYDLINYGICNQYIRCCYHMKRELFLHSLKYYRPA